MSRRWVFACLSGLIVALLSGVLLGVCGQLVAWMVVGPSVHEGAEALLKMLAITASIGLGFWEFWLVYHRL